MAINQNRNKQEIDPNAVKEKALHYHQSGMNGAQSVLKALMEFQLMPEMPELITMTSTWKGGVGGATCSAFAAATLAIGALDENEEALEAFKTWFIDNFGSLHCPTITAQAGGRPSKEQKDYCDLLTARTTEYLVQYQKKAIMGE